jgi:cytolysin-activating lysine-acyltransferase
LADLQPLVLEPLIRDRIAIAHPKGTDRTALVDIAGFAIWASTSQEVDGKIREQIKTGTFPIRLKSEDWQSGEINWLPDVIAPDRKATGQVIANFRQVVRKGDLRIHPQVAGLVDAEMRGKMLTGMAQGRGGEWCIMCQVASRRMADISLIGGRNWMAMLI